MGAHSDRTIEDGRAGVVRNGYQPEREIQTGITAACKLLTEPKWLQETETRKRLKSDAIFFKAMLKFS